MSRWQFHMQRSDRRVVHWPRHIVRSAGRPVMLAGLTTLAILMGLGFVAFLPAVPAADRLLEHITPPRALPAFALRAVNGAFTNSSLQRRWWLVAFGYAGCPDVCPTTLAKLAKVRRRLLAAGETPPGVLFVSVDPGRDTPHLLQAYVAYFSRSFVGVSGTPVQLAGFARAVGASFDVPEQRYQSGPAAAYAVGHSTAIALIDPTGRLVARVVPPFAEQQLADALVAVLHEEGGHEEGDREAGGERVGLSR